MPTMNIENRAHQQREPFKELSGCFLKRGKNKAHVYKSESLGEVFPILLYDDLSVPSCNSSIIADLRKNRVGELLLVGTVNSFGQEMFSLPRETLSSRG